MNYRAALRFNGKLTPVREDERRAKPKTVLHEDEIKTCLSCTKTKCYGNCPRRRRNHD